MHSHVFRSVMGVQRISTFISFFCFALHLKSHVQTRFDRWSDSFHFVLADILTYLHASLLIFVTDFYCRRLCNGNSVGFRALTERALAHTNKHRNHCESVDVRNHRNSFAIRAPEIRGRIAQWQNERRFSVFAPAVAWTWWTTRCLWRNRSHRNKTFSVNKKNRISERRNELDELNS